jgi:hypothetical protein
MFNPSALLPFAIVTLTLLAILHLPLRRDTRYELPEQEPLGYANATRNLPVRDSWFEKLIATLAATMIAWHFVVNS